MFRQSSNNEWQDYFFSSFNTYSSPEFKSSSPPSPQLSTPPSTSPLLNINLFQILEIPVTTTVSECKSAYKGLDGHYYPNKFKDFNFFSKIKNLKYF